MVGVFVNAARELHHGMPRADAAGPPAISRRRGRRRCSTGWPVPVIRALRLKTRRETVQPARARNTDIYAARYVSSGTLRRHRRGAFARRDSARSRFEPRVYLGRVESRERCTRPPRSVPTRLTSRAASNRRPGIKDHAKAQEIHSQCQSLPDSHGHFGEFGGKLCRRDADAGAARTGKSLQRGAPRSGVPRELEALLARIRRAADAALSCGESDRAARRREDLSQARGPLSYRRAQGEQRARSGAARGADGQDAHHRGDRRRSAWRRDGDDGGAVSSASAKSSWAAWTSSARRSTCFA